MYNIFVHATYVSFPEIIIVTSGGYRGSWSNREKLTTATEAPAKLISLLPDSC